MGLLSEFFLEIIGTFILCITILSTQRLIPLIVAVLLIVGVFLFGNWSGGHFNTIVTGMAAFHRQIGWMEVFVFVAGQIVGTSLAVWVHNRYFNFWEKDLRRTVEF